MKGTVTIKFKNGSVITVEPKMKNFGLLDLGNGMSLVVTHGTLYKEKGNIICGEDITDMIDTIEVFLKY